jgi:hypothetical protein
LPKRDYKAARRAEPVGADAEQPGAVDADPLAAGRDALISPTAR